MAILTVYPDAGNPGATTVDGYIQRVSASGESFSTIRSGTGTNVDGTVTTEVSARLLAKNSSNLWDTLTRSIYTFDTSSLSGSAQISSARFSFAASGKSNGLGAFNACVVSATPAANNSLGTADYSNLGATSFGSISVNSVVTGGSYNDITLSSAGVSNINKTGISRFGLRTDWDLNNSPPTWSFQQSYILGYYADQTGNTNDPKLTVFYTTGISYDNSTATAELNNISAGTLSYVTGASLVDSILVLASQTRNDSHTQNGTITSATYAGSALTRVDLSRTTSSRYLTSELWYLIAPTSGTNNLIVNYAGTPAVAKFGALTFSGVDQTNPIDTFASGSSLSQGTPWNVSGTTVADNDWIVNSIYNSYDFTMSVSNSETSAWNSAVNSGGDQAAAAYKGPLTPAGAFTTGYQGTGSAGDEYVLTAVALRPTGGALPSSGVFIGSKLLLGVGV